MLPSFPACLALAAIMSHFMRKYSQGIVVQKSWDGTREQLQRRRWKWKRVRERKGRN